MHTLQHLYALAKEALPIMEHASWGAEAYPDNEDCRDIICVYEEIRGAVNAYKTGIVCDKEYLESLLIKCLGEIDNVAMNAYDNHDSNLEHYARLEEDIKKIAKKHASFKKI